MPLGSIASNCVQFSRLKRDDMNNSIFYSAVKHQEKDDFYNRRLLLCRIKQKEYEIFESSRDNNEYLQGIQDLTNAAENGQLAFESEENRSNLFKHCREDGPFRKVDTWLDTLQIGQPYLSVQTETFSHPYDDRNKKTGGCIPFKMGSDEPLFENKARRIDWMTFKDHVKTTLSDIEKECIDMASCQIDALYSQVQCIMTEVKYIPKGTAPIEYAELQKIEEILGLQKKAFDKKISLYFLDTDMLWHFSEILVKDQHELNLWKISNRHITPVHNINFTDDVSTYVSSSTKYSISSEILEQRQVRYESLVSQMQTLMSIYNVDASVQKLGNLLFFINIEDYACKFLLAITDTITSVPYVSSLVGFQPQVAYAIDQMLDVGESIVVCFEYLRLLKLQGK